MRKLLILIVLLFLYFGAGAQKFVSPKNRSMGDLIDGRENKSYHWIVINGQKWMIQNLNYAAGIGSWCYSLNVLNKMTGTPSEGCEEYGRLYTWETAQNICPDRWHLPSDIEWNDLISFFGGNIEEKKKTKIENSLDFNAQLGGFRNGFGVFRGIGTTGFYWTSSGNEKEGSYRRFDNQAFVLWYNTDKMYGLSVRCAEDQ